MIPIPPSHCVSWRQSASPCGSASTSVSDAAAGRAEAGHALEVRVERPVELRVAGEDVRQRAERRRDEPRQRDDEEALTDAEPVVAARARATPSADRARDRSRDEERPRRLAVADRDGGRDERCDALR